MLAETFFPEIAIAAAVAAFGGMLRGFSGFGPALVMAPVLSVLFDPPQAVAAIILVNVLANFQQLAGAARSAAWRETLPIGISACIAIPFGTYVLTVADPVVMRRIIAAIVLVATFVTWRGWQYRGPRGTAVALGVGATGGLLIGSTTLGGPPMILYLLSGPHTAATVRGSIITVFAITHLSSVTSLAVAGLIDGQTLLRVAILAPPFLLGIWVGGHLFSRANEQVFRRVVLLLLTVVATGILVS